MCIFDDLLEFASQVSVFHLSNASIYLSNVYVCINTSIYLSSCMSVCTYIYQMSMRLSVYVSVYQMSMHLSIYPVVCLFMSISCYLCVCRMLSTIRSISCSQCLFPYVTHMHPLDRFVKQVYHSNQLCILIYLSIYSLLLGSCLWCRSVSWEM